MDGQAPVKPGDELAGKYRVEKILGAGGMGVVVAAMHVQLEERVAIKFLLPAAMSEASVVERFAREARAAVKIKSEHVVRVTDVGSLDNGAPYMVMEHLSGDDLGRILEQHGSPPVDDAIDFIVQALEAIAEAHALGIVHRDLKPANLFLTQRRDGSTCVKVLDFGISKTSGGQTANLTQTASVIGSPHYMSPEQWMSAKDLDGRSDIWSIGCILLQLLTGRPPFEGESVAALCASVLHGAPVSLRALRPDLPEGLEMVVRKCLEKQKEQRFANVGELATALKAFAPARSITSIERVVRTVQGSNPNVAEGKAEQSGPYFSQPAVPAAAASPSPSVDPRTAPSHGGGPGSSGAHAARPGNAPNMTALLHTPSQGGPAPPPAYIITGQAPPGGHPQLGALGSTGAPITGSIQTQAPKKSSAPYVILAIALAVLSGLGAAGVVVYLRMKAAAEELSKSAAGIVATPSSASAAAAASDPAPPASASESPGAGGSPVASSEPAGAAIRGGGRPAGGVHTGGGLRPAGSASAKPGASGPAIAASGPPPPAPPPPKGETTAPPPAPTKKGDLGGRI